MSIKESEPVLAVVAVTAVKVTRKSPTCGLFGSPPM